MAYVHLFFDLDHTLWDFNANAKLTLSELNESLGLKERGVSNFELFYRNYLKHNAYLWERYRNGHIQQKELRVKRMRLALLDFKINDEALVETLSAEFLKMLPTRNVLFPYAVEILQYLSNKNYQLHLITNGFEKVQYEKINHSKIRHFFDKIITSEESNSLKPNKEIFEFALNVSNANIKESIMLGDDMEADIIGASKVGMDQVFINHVNARPGFRPTYMVHSLKELEELF